MPRSEALRIPRLLRDAGTEKITFAGGEPTICPHLAEVLRACKEEGMTTMIVTNGTRVTDSFLEQNSRALDWVTLSVDSGVEDVEVKLGRGKGGHVALVLEVARRVRLHGCRLKVNTVVTSKNWTEDMHSLIKDLEPERWKVFQMLPIKGENDDSLELAVTSMQFRAFLERHRDLYPIGEGNSDMTESYLMMDPLGRFFQNTGGRYQYSPSVVQVGVLDALSVVGWDSSKFLGRGGLYDWARASDGARIRPEGRHGEGQSNGESSLR